MPTQLRADRLYRFYRAGDEETLALQGVSITVQDGEFVAVAGPSGSGKSTMLSCLTGLDEPSGGTVWIGEDRMSHRPERVRARLRATRIGVMSQAHNLFDHLTVIENVRLAQRLGSRRGTRAEATLEAVGVDRRARALPRELSGGEAARAGLAVALANDPLVLIVDEPTGELDESTEERILALLHERARRGTSVVIASHSAAVRRSADRVLVLEDGMSRS
jgi:putative ABC transport system ATP-binding protein